MSVAPPENFGHELILGIVNNGIIATAVAGVGFMISRSIERFKAEQGLRSALTQKQLDSVAEVWQKAAAWDEAIDRTILQYQEARRKSTPGNLSKLEMEFTQHLSVLLAGGDQVRDAARKNRFWTGETIYRFFTDRQRKMRHELQTLSASDEKAIAAMQQRLDGERIEASRILQRFIEESRIASS